MAIDRLVFYDLRGHGEAEGGPSDLGCGEDEDLLALLERLGEDRLLLVGHSLGAVVALQAAARDCPVRERIAGIVALGPYADFHRSLRARLRAAGLPARPVTDLALAWLRLRGLRPPAERAVLAAAAALRCPLLIIQGSDDPIAPLADARRLAERAPDARLVEIPGAAHLDAHEVDARRLEAALGEFVARLA